MGSDTILDEKVCRVVQIISCLTPLYLTELGAKQVGIIQSLLVTCKLHGINPHTYLVDVLQRISQHPASRVIELTPRVSKETFSENPLASELDRWRQ